MWDYGSLDEHQERDYINAKMKMLNKQMPNAEVRVSVYMKRDLAYLHYLFPFVYRWQA